MARAYVGNAADPEQVQRGDRRALRAEALLEDRYRLVLATYEGRAVLWDVLERAGIYRSVFHTDPAVMGFQAGRQDFGLELIATLARADEALYLQMEAEARARKRRDDATTDAGAIPASEEFSL